MNGDTETRADMIRRRLELGGIIAVITGRQARIEMEHPRLHLIDGDGRLSPLPSNTRYVFMTRHTSHNTGGEYIRACRRMGIPFSMEGTGQIKKTLCEIFGIPQSTEYVTESLSTPKPTLAEMAKEILTEVSKPVAEEIPMVKQNGERRGRVKNLILAFPDLDANALLAYAQANGIKTTLNSIKQAIIKYRPRAEKPAKPVKTEKVETVKRARKSSGSEEIDTLAADAHAAIDLLVERIKKYQNLTKILKELKEL